MGTHRITRRQALVAGVTIAPIAATSTIAPTAAQASDGGRERIAADVAALHRLQARFHESISGGGHIHELSSVWAKHATFIVGDTTLRGRDEIRDFFLKTDGFTHNWVSVSPAWKTRFHVRGKMADVYFECHFVDWQANPQVVLTHGTFEGTAREIAGRWLFWHVTAGVTTLTP
jgi:hypothetical protein